MVDEWLFFKRTPKSLHRSNIGLSAIMQKNSKPTPLSAEQKRAQMMRDQAQRALAEANERRAQNDKLIKQQKPVTEKNGRDGPEATRFGDWEKNGIASDF